MTNIVQIYCDVDVLLQGLFAFFHYTIFHVNVSVIRITNNWTTRMSNLYRKGTRNIFFQGRHEAYIHFFYISFQMGWLCRGRTLLDSAYCAVFIHYRFVTFSDVIQTNLDNKDRTINAGRETAFHAHLIRSEILASIISITTSLNSVQFLSRFLG